MKILRYFLFIFAMTIVKINAQQIERTIITTGEVYALFSKKKEFRWAIPVSKSERKILTWKERSTSSTYQEEIHTFLGYDDSQLRATLSVSANGISGSVFTDDGELQIVSREGVIHLVKDTEYSACHATDGKEEQHPEELVYPDSSHGVARTAIEIKNSDVLRVYRLAILIDYSVFKGVHFGTREQVEAFWSDIEVFLNEIYTRDLGIKFEVLRTDALIRDTPEKMVFPPNHSGQYYYNDYYVNYGTEKINALIGKENYDLGMVMTLSRNGGGLAFLRGGYRENTKGASTVNAPSKTTIAHEIGHLFGARHTFSNSPRVIGEKTDQTEPGRGTSVMSYGSPRTFFSLYSIQIIRENIASHPYYEDENRDFVIGSYEPGITNIPLGIKINNHPPRLNKSLLKKEYKIPQETYFQFILPAMDTEQDNLEYLAHQTDLKPYSHGAPPSIARFITQAGGKNSQIAFQPRYNQSGQMFFYTDVTHVGKFTFWLSVRDSRPARSHVTMYDFFETQLNIVSGLPFRFKNFFKKVYKGGERLVLQWDVDANIFPSDSRVRILLSDDFGQTFKYILEESTENDGYYELELPNVNIGKVKIGNLTMNAGVIKIEVLGNLAYALSAVDPTKGGFAIESETLHTTETSVPKKLLYPNPTQGKFQLKGFKKILEVKVYDMAGKLLKQFKKQSHYDISNLPKGNYRVSVQSSEGITNLQLIFS